MDCRKQHLGYQTNGESKVTVYNFQLQAIGTAETNSEGFTEITPQGVPFIVVAEVEKQKAYVRVADGEEQSVSRFDVGGKDIQKGLKGFVYGERGYGDRRYAACKLYYGRP